MLTRSRRNARILGRAATLAVTLIASLLAAPLQAQPHEVANADQADLFTRQSPLAECTMHEPPLGGRGAAVASTWPNGEIYYEFAPDVSQQNRVRARAAMTEIETVCNVTFLPHTGQAGYIEIMNGSGNSSTVGCTGGRQVVTLFNWDWKFVIVHELMHALGLWHEQQRPDRDQYITVNLNNTTHVSQYAIVAGVQPVGPYDFASVMHYYACAFSTCQGCAWYDPGCAVMQALPPNQALTRQLGNIRGISAGDIASLQHLYGGTNIMNNDRFENPTIIAADGAFQFQNFNATTDGQPDASCAQNGADQIERDVWFEWTSAEYGTATVSTCLQTNADTKIAAYEWSSSGFIGPILACNDDDCSLQSRISFPVVAGEVYTIRIGVSPLAAAGGAGSFTITTVPIFRTNNDDCTAAQGLFPGTTVTGNLTPAFNDGNSGCSSSLNPDLWYAFTAPAPGRLTVDTCGTNDAPGLDQGMDTVLSAHSACPGTLANQIACSDDDTTVLCLGQAGAPRDSGLVLDLASGQTVYIRVSYWANSIADGAFRLTSTFNILNDDCPDAQPVLIGAFEQYTLSNATNDGSTTIAAAAASADRWYRFTAPSNGLLIASTCGTNEDPGHDLGMDSVLSIHTGCPGDASNEIASNDNAVYDPVSDSACEGNDSGQIRDAWVEAEVDAGQTVYIRISHVAGALNGGAYYFQTQFAQVNDDCPNATVVTDGAVESGDLQHAGTDGFATCGGMNFNSDNWYVFTAPTDGTLDVTTCGTHDLPGPDLGMDSVLSLHTACPGSAGNEIACNDNGLGAAPCSGDSGLLRDARIRRQMTAGQTVYIRVSHADNGADVTGLYRLAVEFEPDCPADLDANDAVDVFDLLLYLNLWFAGSSGADIDGVPGVDVFDLLEYLNRWFAPC